MKPRVLLIEDCDATRFGFVRFFAKDGYSIREAANLAQAAAAIQTERFEAVIIDINLPDGNGLNLIDTLRSGDNSVPIIVITGAGDIPLAVEAMQRGADNFLTKPVDINALAAFLRKTLEVGALKHRLSARQQLEKDPALFFGTTPAMRQVMHLAQTAAGCDSPLLITGETGTGKGILANWIHRHGSRSAYEFVELNCSGLRGEMLARELFGAQRGAFTSADQDRKGLLDAANRGTLFLDEIGDMSSDVQAQFLKLLEDKTYRRLGDVKLLRSNFRLICATHRELETLIAGGTFRQDLFYRINLIVIEIPPLRERLADLPALAAHLLRELGAAENILSDEVTSLLTGYDWPGNIRELKNVLERAVLLTPPGSTLRRSHFNFPAKRTPVLPPADGLTIQQVEASHIRSILEQTNGNIDLAAKSLNISRATLYRRLKQLRLPPPC